MSILDTIDGALADYQVSRDAVRWVPDEKRPGRHRSAGQISLDGSNWVSVSFDQTPLLPAITIDTSQFEAAFRMVGEAMGQVLGVLVRPFADLVKSVAPIVKVLNEVKAERVSAMHREYRRRSKARRRRR